MAVLRIEKELVVGKEHLKGEGSIREMDPRFTDVDQGWVLVSGDLEEIVEVTRETFDVPSNALNFKEICI